MKSNRAITNIIEYIIAALAILDCNTVYSKIIGAKFSSFSPLIALCLGCLLILKIHGARISIFSLNKMILFLIMYFIGMGLLYFKNAVSSPSPLGFVAKYMIAVPLLLFIFWVDSECSKSILHKYTDLMCIVAVISILFWVLVSQLHLLRPTTFFYVNWGRPYRYPAYWYIYVERQVEIFFGMRIKRNIAFFTEAPMYSASLVMALALEVFVGEKNKLKICLLYIAIITTFSTTGLLMGILIFLMNFFQLKADTKNKFWVKLMLGTIVVGVGSIAFYAIFMQKVSAGGSWSGRLLSIAEGYKVMKDNPLYGCGYRSFKAYLKYMPAYRANANMGTGGSASGIGSLMGQCGLILTGFYINAFGIAIFNAKKKKDLGRLFLSSIVLIILFFAVIQYTFIMLLFIVSFYSQYIDDEGKLAIIL